MHSSTSSYTVSNLQYISINLNWKFFLELSKSGVETVFTQFSKFHK